MHKKYVFGLIAFIILIIASVGAWQFFKVSPPPAGSLERLALERASSTEATFTLQEVAAHSTEADCWTVVSGGVYDLTSFIPQHPGGRAIIPACGTDGTQLFSLEPEHAEENAMQILESTYRIGSLK